MKTQFRFWYVQTGTRLAGYGGKDHGQYHDVLIFPAKTGRFIVRILRYNYDEKDFQVFDRDFEERCETEFEIEFMLAFKYMIPYQKLEWRLVT